METLANTIKELSDSKPKVMEQIRRLGKNYRVTQVTPIKDKYEIIARRESLFPENYKGLGLIDGRFYAWLTLDGIEALTDDQVQELNDLGYEAFCTVHNCV